MYVCVYVCILYIGMIHTVEVSMPVHMYVRGIKCYRERNQVDRFCVFPSWCVCICIYTLRGEVCVCVFVSIHCAATPCPALDV